MDLLACNKVSIICKVMCVRCIIGRMSWSMVSQMPSESQERLHKLFFHHHCFSNVFRGMVCGMVISKTKLITEETVNTVSELWRGVYVWVFQLLYLHFLLERDWSVINAVLLLGLLFWRWESLLRFLEYQERSWFQKLH